jgi:hypothetical protein
MIQMVAASVSRTAEAWSHSKMRLGQMLLHSAKESKSLSACLRLDLRDSENLIAESMEIAAAG